MYKISIQAPTAEVGSCKVSRFEEYNTIQSKLFPSTTEDKTRVLKS